MFSMTNAATRRLAILSFIRERTEADGRPPSLAEIAEACGFASRAAVQKHVKALQASGQLEVSEGKARSARPKKPRMPHAVGAGYFFEVSAADIAGLSDLDLRELVSRVCIAKLASKQLPPDYVTWGGDHRAADGGIDVRIQMPSNVAETGGFPAARVGYQVKATAMPESEIQKEMCPGGMLRSSIRELIRAKGAYIIACSDNVSDSSYRNRVAEMQRAAAAEGGSAEAHFDFYDSQRLADQTNQHPGVVAWVRSRLGNALRGWRPAGQWVTTRGAKPHPFLDDAAPRLIDAAGREFALAEGLRQVRTLLRKGATSVRIAGLSGVGKTRFAQALFEEQALPGALSPELVVYTDTADAPTPGPLALVDELVAKGRRAILVIDNCSWELHAQLTSRCKASNGIGLLTIEYDIREDHSDETTAFKLKNASAELVEKVIEQQFPQISGVNVATMSRFADGNSRVALALANTLDRDDSLAGFSDPTLFDRLFRQQHHADSNLQFAARVCALVYSFGVEDADDELPQLASLADMTPITLYKHVDELLHRGLAQKRGPWRAILPQAVANTLAARALTAIPYAAIDAHLVAGRGRLLRSFSRRLGYLHASEDAVKIVRGWFTEGGLLGNLARLEPPLDEVLRNVAPVDPPATLAAIKRAAASEDSDAFLSSNNFVRTRVVRILRSIAWDQACFEDCVELLVKFALAEPEDNRVDATRGVIKSLFAAYLSGTHATLKQRSTWVRRALQSAEPQIQRIGAQCLAASLEAHHFSSHYGFDFGARPRDFANLKDNQIYDWYASFIDLATETALQQNDVGRQAGDILASNFRALWSAGMAKALEAAIPQLQKAGWEKGWLAIKQTIRFDASDMSAEMQTRLQELERLTRPTSLVERTKAIVLNPYAGGLDITEFDDEPDSGGNYSHQRAEKLATELGKMVVAEPDALAELIPLLVENQQGRHWAFGAGMATGADDAGKVWQMLRVAFEAASVDSRNIQIFRGFLSGAQEREPALFERLMEDALAHEALLVWAPILEVSATLTASGCERLLRLLESPAVPVGAFRHLGYGRATENVPDHTLARIAEQLARKAAGLEVAIEVLAMHVYNNSAPSGKEVTRVARSLLVQFSPSRENQHLDYSLKLLIERFLYGADGEISARLMLRKIREGFDNYSLSYYNIDDAVAALFQLHPVAALDELVGDGPDEGRNYIRRRGLRSDHSKNAVEQVPMERLIEWCMQSGVNRWKHIAAVIPAFDRDAEETELNWSAKALALLSCAPDPIAVAGVLVARIEPMSWSGSRARIIAMRMPLLDKLSDVLGESGACQLREWRSYLQASVEREREREFEQHRKENERFE